MSVFEKVGESEVVVIAVVKFDDELTIASVEVDDQLVIVTFETVGEYVIMTNEYIDDNHLVGTAVASDDDVASAVESIANDDDDSDEEPIIVKDAGKSRRAYRPVNGKAGKLGQLRMFGSNFRGNTGNRHRKSSSERQIDLNLRRRTQDRLLVAAGHNDWLLEREEQADNSEHYDLD